MECKDFQKLINDFTTLSEGDLAMSRPLMAVRKVLMLHRNWKILLIFMMNILKNKEKERKQPLFLL